MGKTKTVDKSGVAFTANSSTARLVNVHEMLDQAINPYCGICRLAVNFDETQAKYIKLRAKEELRRRAGAKDPVALRYAQGRRWPGFTLVAAE